MKLAVKTRDKIIENKYKKAIIEDVVNNKCSENEITNLLDIFEYTIKRMGLSRKSWFELSDFATSKKRKITKFELMVERKQILGQEQFWGMFKKKGKTLQVIGTLEI